MPSLDGLVGAHEVGDGPVGFDRDRARARQILYGLHSEIGVNGSGAVADEQGDVVDLAHVAGLDD